MQGGSLNKGFDAFDFAASLIAGRASSRAPSDRMIFAWDAASLSWMSRSFIVTSIIFHLFCIVLLLGAQAALSFISALRWNAGSKPSLFIFAFLVAGSGGILLSLISSFTLLHSFFNIERLLVEWHDRLSYNIFNGAFQKYVKHISGTFNSLRMAKNSLDTQGGASDRAQSFDDSDRKDIEGWSNNQILVGLLEKAVSNELITPLNIMLNIQRKIASSFTCDQLSDATGITDSFIEEDLISALEIIMNPSEIMLLLKTLNSEIIPKLRELLTCLKSEAKCDASDTQKSIDDFLGDKGFQIALETFNEKCSRIFIFQIICDPHFSTAGGLLRSVDKYFGVEDRDQAHQIITRISQLESSYFRASMQKGIAAFGLQIFAVGILASSAALFFAFSDFTVTDIAIMCTAMVAVCVFLSYAAITIIPNISRVRDASARSPMVAQLFENARKNIIGDLRGEKNQACRISDAAASICNPNVVLDHVTVEVDLLELISSPCLVQEFATGQDVSGDNRAPIMKIIKDPCDGNIIRFGLDGVMENGGLMVPSAFEAVFSGGNSHLP